MALLVLQKKDIVLFVMIAPAKVRKNLFSNVMQKSAELSFSVEKTDSPLMSS